MSEQAFRGCGAAGAINVPYADDSMDAASTTRNGKPPRRILTATEHARLERILVTTSTAMALSVGAFVAWLLQK